MARNQTRPILIDGQGLTLKKAEKIAKGGEVRIEDSMKSVIEESRSLVAKVAKGKKSFYGINTGFGYLANKKITPARLKTLQLNIIKSHAGGYGAPLSIPETRLAMALRLNVLVKGVSGVRYELCEALCKLLKYGIYPIIPEYGSVGASGDLAPLAHLALPLIGEGMVHYKGKVISASSALKRARLSPITLCEKEGLGLINGTQVMSAVGGLTLSDAFKTVIRANKVAAVSYEGSGACVDALDPLLHKARGQIGQLQCAEEILNELQGSYLFDLKASHKKVQDPYSLRCAAQVHGPTLDALGFAKEKVEIEMNAATDNPLVFAKHGKIISGGNFHGQTLALSFDFAAMAIAEIGNISERRLELLLNPNMSNLPAFLIADPGTQSGYMITQYLAASLVNENKILANPACTDSIPGNVGIEDHVSMGMTSARKLKKILCNVKTILAIELMVACQAIDIREAPHLGKGTQKSYDKLRRRIPKLTKDRIISDDVKKAVSVLEKL